MRFWILSDLHLEYADLSAPLPIPDADAYIVAGDLCRVPAKGIHWLARQVPHSTHRIYFAGNHEFYNSSIRQGLEDDRAAAVMVACGPMALRRIRESDM